MAMVAIMVSKGRTLSSSCQSRCPIESCEAPSFIILLLTIWWTHRTYLLSEQFWMRWNIIVIVMLSDQEIRSLVRIDTVEQEEDDEQTENEPMLDLSHKELRRLKQIELSPLQVGRVDASYNYFKSFQDLNFKEVNERLPVPVSWLDLSFNYFTRIDQAAESAHVLQFLKHLNISANRLQSVDFSALEVPQLEYLNVSNNQLQFFLDCPKSLRVLVLDHNRLTSLGFRGGSNLSMLSARNNAIKRIGVELPALLLLDLDGNQVDDVEAVRELVGYSPELLSINFRGNPVSTINSYRLMLLQHCQCIAQIDDITISPHIREGYKVLKSEEKLEEMLQQANRKYADRLAQKQKVKEQLLKKMQEQQKLIEQRFQEGIQQERGQFQELEKQAQSILGKKRLNIAEETNQFSSKLNVYGEKQQACSPPQEKIIEVQSQHLKEYLQYLKKRPQSQPTRGKTIRLSKKSKAMPNRQIREQFKGIVLFDHKCIKNLLEDYQFDQAQM